MLRYFIPLLLVLGSVAVAAQAPDQAARRIDERMRALQRESDQLAKQAQTLIGELRKLELERDLRTQEALQAETAAAEAQQALASATERLAAIEQQRASQLPDLKVQLVDIYKRGRSGYARMLFGARNLRDFARATRAISALTAINQRRVADHQRTLAALSQERATRERTATELQRKQEAAQQARAAAERALTARAALIKRIDSRRDLTAQYAGELQVAYDRLQQQLAAGRKETVSVPLAPFRGALDWPATGRITGRFGQASDRLGGNAVRNGIEVMVAEDAAVRAVHSGTVSFAGPYPGFGNLVIVEHGGNNYSLYGYLGAITVERGAMVDAGTELGRAGFARAGPPSLYFEMRIDGRSVDPLQWLKAR